MASALIETTKQILGSPNDFFRVMPTTGGIGSPLLYAVIIGWIGLAASAFYQALFNSVVGSGMAALGRTRSSPRRSTSPRAGVGSWSSSSSVA